MGSWPEIENCKEKNRRELSIKDCSSRFEEIGYSLPVQLYQLQLVNFLEISGCGITNISEDIGYMSALANLILNRNKLKTLPDSLCKLVNLKVIDLSDNEITELPEDIGLLTSLQTMSLNSNKLASLPDSVKEMTLLSVINLSNNCFERVPEILLCGSHSHLSELKASHNVIEDIDDAIGSLEALKLLDLSCNKIKELPQTLGDCMKLKTADYVDNPLKDRRLKKLIEQKNSSQKAIMEYIRTKGRPRENSASGGKISQSGKRKKKGSQNDECDNDDLVRHKMRVLRFDVLKDDSERTLEITVSDEIKEVRPYIVCCIVKRLNLTNDIMLKKFIAIQTKLHEGPCAKRTVATIATHDVSSLKNSNLVYDAKEPDQFSIQPLGRTDEVTGLELYHQLKMEAEDKKKEKKKNLVSGIYKFLSLLEKHEKFPHLKRLSDGAVISLPPLTNSDLSKIKVGENDILLEVTGGQTLNSCKTIMDKLLLAMVKDGLYSCRQRDFYSDSSDEDSTVTDDTIKVLIIQQVRISDSQGKLKVVYPSRTDLAFNDPAIKVERPK